MCLYSFTPFRLVGWWLDSRKLSQRFVKYYFHIWNTTLRKFFEFFFLLLFLNVEKLFVNVEVRVNLVVASCRNYLYILSRLLVKPWWFSVEYLPFQYLSFLFYKQWFSISFVIVIYFVEFENAVIISFLKLELTRKKQYGNFPHVPTT